MPDYWWIMSIVLVAAFTLLAITAGHLGQAVIGSFLVGLNLGAVVTLWAASPDHRDN